MAQLCGGTRLRKQRRRGNQKPTSTFSMCLTSYNALSLFLRHQLPGAAQLRTGGIRSIAHFQQPSIVLRSVTLLASGFGGAGSAVEAIEAVGMEFEVRLIFRQCLLWTLRFQQYVSDHFARWNAFWFIAQRIFLGGDGTQCLDGIAILAFGERQPGLGYFAIIFDGVGKIRFLGYLLFMNALNLREILANVVRLVQMRRPDCPLPVNH